MPDLGDIGRNMGNPNQPAAKPNLKDMTYTALVSQSGYEAATGDYTIVDSKMRQMIDQSKKMAAEMGGKVETKEDEVRAAPMLFLFAAGALGGVILGLVIPSGGTRKLLLVLCCGLALASAGVQAAIGFPITEDVKKNPGAGAGKNDLNLSQDDMLKTVYKAPFYLALLFALGGLVTTLIEPGGAPAAKRRRDDDYFDDDPRDDEEDRAPPRK
jgi:hypothetical protein